MAEFLSGFVSIVGCPNVGKSTLINAFAGQKISITSAKPQTTRNRIHGVLNGEGMQIVFIDTPGINRPRNKLGEYMISVALEALNEVECVLYVSDAVIGIREQDENLLDKLRKVQSKVIAAVNKTDAASGAQTEETLARLRREDWLHAVMPISAATGAGLDELIAALRKCMISGPMYYPEDMVTDQPERVICQEFVREKALQLLQDEIPHGIGVDIEKMQLQPNGVLDVYATIYCEKDSHKGIVIGRRGEMLKQIGMRSRKDIEWMTGQKVNLQLWVKVKEDWRNSQNHIRMLGYE